MRAQGQTPTILSSIIVIAAVAVIAMAVFSVLIQQFGFTALGAALPALLCFAGLLLIQRIAQRASLVQTLAQDVARLEAELQDLGPGGRALEQASDDLAKAAHTLRGFDAPEVTTDLPVRDRPKPRTESPDLPVAERFGKRAAASPRATALRSEADDSVPPSFRYTKEQRDLAAEPVKLKPEPVAAEAHADANLPAPADTAAGMVLPTLSRAESIDPQLSELLRRVANDGNVEILLQPIIALADRKPRLYDVFPRLRRMDGTRVSPAEYWGPAHQLGVALVIERHVVLRASQILQRLNEKGRARNLFCRLSQTALADPALISGLVSSLRPAGGLAENIVIELSARDYFRNAGLERDGMAELGRLGVRFALEGVESLVVDRHRLAADRISHLKLTPQALATEHRIAGFDGMAGLISDLRRSGMDVVLDQVTDEGMAMLGLDCGIILAQGPLFGEARPIASEYLGESRQPAAHVA